MFETQGQWESLKLSDYLSKHSQQLYDRANDVSANVLSIGFGLIFFLLVLYALAEMASGRRIDESKSVVNSGFAYVFRGLFHLPVSACVVAVGCAWAEWYLLSLSIFLVSFLLLWFIPDYMAAHLPERADNYHSAAKERMGQCFGMAILSGVRAPISYWLVDSPGKQWLNPLEWACASLLVVAFLFHAWHLWHREDPPQWIQDVKTIRGKEALRPWLRSELQFLSGWAAKKIKWLVIR